MATTIFSPNSAEQLFNQAGAIAVNTNLFWIDTGRMCLTSALTLQIVSIGTSGVVAPEFSHDDTIWRGGVLEQADSLTPTRVATANAAGLFLIPITARFFRLRLSTGATGGTTRVFIGVESASTLRVSQTSGNVGLVAGIANIGQVAAQAPNVIADVASGAITSTTTTAAFTPTADPVYSVNIPVTAVSGTTPTMDVGVEESDNGGTNWFRVYDFPRITAIGVYRSPSMPLRGNRVRYVQTLSGTTPSFTRTINRNQIQEDTNHIRQIFDRAVAPNTLNATTATMVAASCGNQVKMAINMGAITTTAPAFQLEGSDDGANWVAIGAPLTGVANSTVVGNNTGNNWAFCRARVSTAGVGATLGANGVLIRAYS